MKSLPRLLLILGLLAVFVTPVVAQEKEKPAAPLTRSELIAAAREIIGAQQYCALITLDEQGRPVARTMNPFPPEDDMTVWIATNALSRKVQQLRHDPRVTLYYADHSNATGLSRSVATRCWSMTAPR